MTSVLHPRSHSFTSRSPSGGILLNPSPYGCLSALPQRSYPSRSNQSLSSSTSSSEDINTPSSSLHATLPSPSNSVSPPNTSDEDRIVRLRSGSGAECGASGSRRIRFAPLPDPRRAVLVTEHGEELPLPSVFDDDDPSGIPNPKLRDLSTFPHSSLLLGDGAGTPREVPAIVTSGPSLPVQTPQPSPPSPARVTESPTPSTETITSAGLFPSASSSRLARRLFYPFRQKCDDTRRSDSRDSSSSRDDSPSLGAPLGHWRSADESISTTSANPEHIFRARSATTAQPKPKRMLNGRMYGARKHPHQSTNVFSNIPDDEPEFVEWGYGGMGSVKAGGIWAKVQSDQKLGIGHDEERGRRGAPQSSPDDDGSGMGWVKRRREERERKRLEEEAASKAASKSDDDPALTLHPAPVPIPESTPTHVPALVLADHKISTVTLSQPTHEIDDESSDESDEEVDDESIGTEQEDDDADQEQHFKQVAGAGVERVSRHRD